MAQSIQPATRLPELTWAKKLGISRSDIRQALVQLLAEGFIVSGDKGGFFSKVYSEQDILQATEARFILEAGVARLAVERASEEEILELEEICRHMRLMNPG